MRPSPGAIIVLVATILSLLVTISAPYVRAFDDVRVSFSGTAASGENDAINQFRLGIWGFCQRMISNGDWVCQNTGLAYSYGVQGANGNQQWVGSSWTRGLVMSAVATGFLVITTAVAFTKHHIIAALLSWWSGLVTFIFMAINLALYLKVRAQMRHLGTIENTDFGPGFWMSLAVLILTLAAGFVLLIQHRRARTGVDTGSSYRYASNGGFFSRFRK
ncbi:hypothetical protein FRC04_006889 [Tulasnella sp. 424]|nr:hypothetical protein FRC04_006889 [Tulasnella sp. 424]KAG8974394.1 hypothetical protein FRC05_007555 [Tulasnella sp. 425]